MEFPKSIPNSNTRGLIEIAAIVVIAVLVAIIVRTFLLQLFYIPTGSMDPYLKVNDKVFVNKLAYDFHDIERGDVVVFKAPDSVRIKSELDHKRDPKNYKIIKDLIKRVIGLPGETIEGTCPNQESSCVLEIYIDGKKLNEPYLEPGIFNEPFGPKTISANSLFMMGDNRDQSDDSRVFGEISKDDVIGRAFFRLWPPSGFGFLG